MLFNSLEFGIFLIVVFLLYWLVFNKNIRCQNAFLLVASYFFYGWWDWRFLILIFISSVTDYWVGLAMDKAQGKKRRWFLYLSLFINIGMLGFFKYFNFFVESFVDAFTFFGATLDVDRLNIILPVGISFYTFQTLSYTLDIYKKRLKPTKNFFAFLGFVAFFPQLVAGPIERARNLLPQFLRDRKFDMIKASDGMRQMLWGLFKKVVIADNCAIFVDYVYDNSATQSGSTLFLAITIFLIQVYGDFSGYSDIAIGCARLFGFNLRKNFGFPFYARSIPEFWRKWHISLTFWFRDYVFVPMTLKARERTRWLQFQNTLILFVLIGFWHGASWTFVAFGFMHGVLFFRSIYLKRFSLADYLGLNQDGYLVTMGRRLQTFFLIVFASLYFGMESLAHGWEFITGMADPSLLSLPSRKLNLGLVALLAIFLYVEWRQREKEHGLDFTGLLIQPWKRYVIYFSIMLAIFLFKAPTIDFIYFQF
ncbi:MAG: MBOAT family O-acyltransferase [Saprospiraceae bacterium]|nr:MBOAT family O-acyltransferase [Saprospiraceae bacterium]